MRIRAGKLATALLAVLVIAGAGALLGAGASIVLSGTTYQITDGVTYSAPSGPAVQSNQTLDILDGNPFTDANTVDLKTSQGNATFSSPGPTNVTVDTWTGEWTNVSQLDVAQHNLTIDPEDKDQIIVGGDADTLKYRDMTVDDGQVDFIYSGASGTTYVRIPNLAANTYYGVKDVDTGEWVGAAETTSNGWLNVSLSNSEHTVELQSSDGKPDFVAGTESPTGEQSTAPTELGINVTDPDFPEDNVTVTFYHKNETESTYNKVGTTTLTDEGRATTTTISDTRSGDHSWYAVAEDLSGQTRTSSTFEYGVANEVFIYNESSPETLITQTVNITAYYGDQVIETSTSDGSFNLTGFPADERITIKAESDSYRDRTIVIESISDQHSIYLLHENVSAVEVRFKLDDRTGNFPSDDSTTLFIKRPLNTSGSTSYQTVLADQFGTNGVTGFLEEGVRYRLIVENSDGDRRVLGSFTATVSETVTLTIGTLTYDTYEKNTAYSYEATYDNTSTTNYVRFNYSDPTSQTENLHIQIYERGNQSNLLFETTEDGPFGNYSVSQAVPSDEERKDWVVDINYDYGTEPVSFRLLVGPQTSPGVPLDPAWKGRLSLGLIIVVAGLFGGIRADIGGVVAGLMAGVAWYIQWLPAETAGGAVAAALFLAILWKLAFTRAAGI